MLYSIYPKLDAVKCGCTFHYSVASKLCSFCKQQNDVTSFGYIVGYHKSTAGLLSDGDSVRRAIKWNKPLNALLIFLALSVESKMDCITDFCVALLMCGNDLYADLSSRSFVVKKKKHRWIPLAVFLLEEVIPRIL